MKKNCSFATLFLVATYFFSLYSQELTPIWSAERLQKDTSKADFDGPYIFYSEENTTIKQITQKNNSPFVASQTFTKSIKGKKLKSYLSKDHFFSFKVKKELKNEPSKYPMPDKLIAISDIEGNYQAFEQFLIHNKVMNKRYKWTYGKGHLVLLGDFFDRGLFVTQTLWLIYHLESQAEKAGGKIHFILGNHDLMNMNNDFRYVRKKYQENASLMNTDYLHFYKPNTELGRWLATKNIVEKIGGYVFVHAGISKEVANLDISIPTLNENARKYYFDNKKAQHLNDGLLSVIYQFGLSPIWYRGFGKQTIDKEEFNYIRQRFGADKFVIGHTLHQEISYLYDQKVIDIDVDHAQGITQGLLIENGREYKVDILGNKSAITSLTKTNH
ncbi:MAG: metallophosphoesterase [Capnocytophaga sp.]|nr:metallophosphoesterase [Capnocytophaga sp.]